MFCVVRRILLIITLLCISTGAVSAQGRVERVGVVNSLKEFGFSIGVRQGHDSSLYNTFSLKADMEGIFLGMEMIPGVKFSYTHQNFMKKGSFRGGEALYALFFGGGFCGGYVKDSGGEWLGHGPMAGLAADAGALFLFPCRIDIMLSLSGEFGLYLRKDQRYGSTELSWYRNGVVKAWIPNVTIFYRF